MDLDSSIGVTGMQTPHSRRSQNRHLDVELLHDHSALLAHAEGAAHSLE